MSKIGFAARLGVAAAVSILPFVAAAAPAQAGVLSCTDTFLATLNAVDYVDHCLLNDLGNCTFFYDPLAGGVAPETIEYANCVI